MRKGIRINFLFITGILSVFLLSCEQKTEKKEALPVVEVAPEPKVEEAPSEEAQLREEVMAIHDRAMLRLSEIRKLSNQLNDSIENTGVNPMFQEEAINTFRNRLKELKEADDNMRQWMRNFKQEENMSAEEQTEYLRREKQKIQQVEQEMNDAIDAAREVLNK